MSKESLCENKKGGITHMTQLFVDGFILSTPTLWIDSHHRLAGTRGLA